VNGDGLADIVGFGQAGVYVSLATGAGHFAAPTLQVANFGPGAGGWSSDNLYPRELADVNGDGTADIVGFGQAGVYESLAIGTGHLAAAPLAGVPLPASQDVTLNGGGGPDNFLFRPNFGANVITDFNVNNSAIQFDRSILSSASDILAHTVNSVGGVVVSDGHGHTDTLSGVTLAQLQAHQSDFHLV
jgi:hypothetical protein